MKRGKDWNDLSTSQGNPGLPDGIRRQEKGMEILPEILQKELTTNKFEFGIPASRIVRRCTSLVFKAHSLW